MPFLIKYWVYILIISMIIVAASGWVMSYGNKKWWEGYNKCEAEYEEAVDEHSKNVQLNLPKVEKKYDKTIKSVQGSSAPVGPATTAALDSLRRRYESDNR